MNIIKRIFRKSEPKAIQALRAFHAENQADMDWRKAIGQQAQALRAEMQAAIDNIRDNPSDSALARVVAASDKVHRADALEKASVAAADTIKARCRDRIIEPLRDALQAVSVALENTRHEVEESDRKTSERLGIEVGASPVLRQIDGELGDVQRRMAQIDGASFEQLQSAVKFCLDRDV